ncbi:hypothetical protein HL033_04080 [Neoehrlichia mikurensis]|uniref:ATP synthase F1 complex delta/epsilon subunit N-terminal domain-containing protein n=1 Tax=Neoehrlichia mikurensis TaxID=89586 RepID=A0A9Q9C0L3_9RICK|nr:hypothetical protein [Neoehrlichia mikurensis]QXK91900.1 hypothetical protein IAH97_04075 [Neoehrlichia mikurensis]QXK93113.1 hypothetical protein HUN61_04070 [Neoehrlichia mikurensis]QXK93593.1 hypothetical protein HL033_04080 [Neoehrlichia mikurensis]UTO55454.1 hypothetical protein LUA82_04800 [Neoehrlichia mikurensis]UTO56374.1 hypothetical protein LUA81_04745 [Neoehrlichia mikurensis]
MQSITVKFTTPDCEIIFDNIYSLSTSTNNGKLVIMPNHEKFIMNLCPGFVILNDIFNVTTNVIAASAILSVYDNMCNIVADIAFVYNKSNIKRLKEIKNLFEDNIPNVIDNKLLFNILSQDLKFINKVLNCENIS